MKCIICDLNSVDENTGGDSDDDDDIPLDLMCHRKLLLSIFCKYFNWENNYDLTPSQLLSWIPSSSTAASNFPFCSKCEDKMNELNDLHDSLAKIQLNISTLISSMSMEIIKVVESSSSFSSPQKSKQSLITTSTIVHENKGARSSRRLQAKENEVQILDSQGQDYDDGGSKLKTTNNKDKSKSLSKSITPEPKSVNEFRKNVYKKFKPQVIVQDCKKPQNLKVNSSTTTTTTTTTTSSSPQSTIKSRRGRPTKLQALEKLAQLRAERKEAARRRRQDREEKEREKQAVVNMTVTPNVSTYLNANSEECDTMTIKDEPASPAHSPDHDDTFDDNYPDDDDNGPGISAGDEYPHDTEPSVCSKVEVEDNAINKEDHDDEISNIMETGTSKENDLDKLREKVVQQQRQKVDDPVLRKFRSLCKQKGFRNLSKWKLMEMARKSPAKPKPQTEEEKDEEYAQKYYWTVPSKFEYRKLKNAPKWKLIEIARTLRPKPKPKEPSPPPPPVETVSSSVEPSEEEEEEDDEEDDDERDSDFEPYPNKPEEKKSSSIQRPKETEPGSNIFRYYNWEFAKISETDYKCLTCDVILEERQHMLNHINKKHNDVIPRCDKCKRTWFTQELKDQHKCKPKTGHVKSYQEVSPGQFMYLNKYLYQKVDKNSNDQGLEFLCLNETCDKRTRTSEFMRAHIRKVHDGSNSSFICDICGQTYSSVSNLNTHKARHTDTRDHICEICGSGFKTRSSLNLHLRNHQGPYVCGFEGCSKQYNGPNGLARHRLDASHPAEKKQLQLEECPNCGKKYVGEARLAKHLASLKCVIQKVNCNFCGKELAPHFLTSHQKKFCHQNPDYPERMVNKTSDEENSVESHNEEVEHQQPPSQPEFAVQNETRNEQESEPQAYDNTANANVNYYEGDWWQQNYVP